MPADLAPPHPITQRILLLCKAYDQEGLDAGLIDTFLEGVVDGEAVFLKVANYLQRKLLERRSRSLAIVNDTAPGPQHEDRPHPTALKIRRIHDTAEVDLDIGALDACLGGANKEALVFSKVFLHPSKRLSKRSAKVSDDAVTRPRHGESTAAMVDGSRRKRFTSHRFTEQEDPRGPRKVAFAPPTPPISPSRIRPSTSQSLSTSRIKLFMSTPSSSAAARTSPPSPSRARRTMSSLSPLNSKARPPTEMHPRPRAPGRSHTSSPSTSTIRPPATTASSLTSRRRSSALNPHSRAPLPSLTAAPPPKQTKPALFTRPVPTVLDRATEEVRVSRLRT
ncbi:hypothetical protein FB45DRAFT_900918 [Roridomyces roridus]|uniref:Uncharacterized protein n=1 Tax=Roridomyces roridus TaxID=1738132 RepID=A0AAD7C8H7_9AGAR|nr:hypothetical protein FB45DRAFT_900918 [Roridomyces roridus]